MPRGETTGASMSEKTEIQLSDEDVEYLIAMIRSSPTALTTDELVEALRLRTS
jgi:hypothetical protein